MSETNNYSNLGQKVHHSFIESVVNILIGYGVAVTAQVIIFPFFGIHIPIKSNLLIGAIFTIVSLCRSFTLRRIFNGITIKEGL